VHQQGPETVVSTLVKSVRRIRSLERAWRAIQENARTSKSEEVRREVKDFAAEAGSRIGSIAYRLARGKFQFVPAKGLPIAKLEKDGTKSKTKFRPIVLAPLESRIVQRSILETLAAHKGMSSYINTPYSFGGIKKQDGANVAAVPAAISAVLDAIRCGAKFYASADISAFFTRIPKSKIRSVIAGVVQDAEFMALFDAAIKVELENMAELREKVQAFPIEDIGVAQGNSLSPLLGNVLLFEFDKAMNDGDCRCIRYIDDFIILAPTRKAAAARLKKAKELLAEHGMTLSPEKSSKEPASVDSAFEFLGIELNNGLIRPTTKACKKLLAQIDDATKASTHAFRVHRAGQKFPKAQSLVETLKRIDGIVQGWGKHYRFCNDSATPRHLDEQVKKRLAAYIGAYVHYRDEVHEGEKLRLLGIEILSSIEARPLIWPTRR